MNERPDYDPPTRAWEELNEFMASVEKKGKHVKGEWRGKTTKQHIERALEHILKWRSGEKIDPDDNRHHLLNAFTRLGMAYETDTMTEKKRKAVVYLASPYAAPNEFDVYRHVVAAHITARTIWGMGFVCLSPISNSAFFSGNDITQDEWIDGDLLMLRNCDALYLNEGWQGSDGCKEEKSFAEQHEIPVFTNLNALTKWRDS